MWGGFVFDFKVHVVGCRFYAILGGFFLLCVVGTFIWSYVHYPAAREVLLHAVLRHYLPMAALFVVVGMAVWRLWVKLDRS